MAAEVVNSPESKLKFAISDRRRELMHNAMDGRADLVGVMQVLHGYKFCDNFLIFLIENKITGNTLAEMVVKEFRSSVPSMVEWMVGYMNRVTGAKMDGSAG